MTPAEPTGQRDRAGELAEAERRLHEYADGYSGVVLEEDLDALFVEYERRAVELHRLRAALARAQTVVAAARALVDQYDATDFFWSAAHDVLRREVRALDSDGGGSGG